MAGDSPTDGGAAGSGEGGSTVVRPTTGGRHEGGAAGEGEAPGSAGGQDGGSDGSGGTTSTGGSDPETGGRVSEQGGSRSTGGEPPVQTGGVATGTGGQVGVVCDRPWTVGNDGFVRAQGADGACWHGYAFTGKGTASTIMPEKFSQCGAGCMLCADGTVAKSADSSEVAFLGFNINQSPGASATTTAKPTGTALTVSFTKSGTFPLRVQILAKNATAASRWCAEITGTSPATIPYAMFNTECWEGGAGTAYNPAMGEIEAVMLLIPGNTETDVAFSACLTGVKDG